MQISTKLDGTVKVQLTKREKQTLRHAVTIAAQLGAMQCYEEAINAEQGMASLVQAIEGVKVSPIDDGSNPLE